MITNYEYDREMRGLSTDTKPTDGVPNGAIFLEMDTSKIYFFNADDNTWEVWGA